MESQLIKQHLPLYNRLLRNSHNLTLITKKIINEYSTIDFDVAKNLSQYSPNEVLAIIKSRRSAGDLIISLADEHHLCKKILGLEKSSTCCFAYHLGKCKGACIGKEPPQLHNLRFDLAFTKTKLRSWPFSNQMTITETDPITHLTDIFFIDNWCVTKKISIKGGQVLSSETFPASFDIDSYHILIRHLHLCRPVSSTQLDEFSSQLGQ